MGTVISSVFTPVHPSALSHCQQNASSEHSVMAILTRSSKEPIMWDDTDIWDDDAAWRDTVE